MYKNIQWYEWKYKVSSDWNVIWSKSNKILKPYLNKDWYLYVSLYSDATKFTKPIHRIVLSTFINNELNKPCVNHINWIKTDNRVENLECVTHSENNKHAYDTWLNKNHHFYINHPFKWKLWKDNHLSKIIIQYNKLWEVIKEWWWSREIERELWIAHQNISSCCSWKTKTSWWFIWKYA